MNKEQYLKDLMEAKSGSVRAFSIDIGIPYSTIRSILTRGVMNSTVDNVIKICKGLGIKPEELAEMSDSVLNDIHKTVIQLSESRQQNVYQYAKQQLTEQNKSKVIELPSDTEDDGCNDPTMVIAAHMDDDFTEEEMEEVLRFIEFAKSKRKK